MWKKAGMWYNTDISKTIPAGRRTRNRHVSSRETQTDRCDLSMRAVYRRPRFFPGVHRQRSQSPLYRGQLSYLRPDSTGAEDHRPAGVRPGPDLLRRLRIHDPVCIFIAYISGHSHMYSHYTWRKNE